MSEITIKISAPELATAIHALAAALSQSAATQQAPMQQAPVQQSQGFQQTVPVVGAQSYQYVTPPQQPPVQQSGMPSGMPLQGVPQQPAPQQPALQQQPPSGVPTTTPSYTSDQLALAATQLVDAGRIEEIRGLLAQFGIPALTMLPPDQYGAFATALRGMGAKI